MGLTHGGGLFATEEKKGKDGLQLAMHTTCKVLTSSARAKHVQIPCQRADRVHYNAALGTERLHGVGHIIRASAWPLSINIGGTEGVNLYDNSPMLLT